MRRASRVAAGLGILVVVGTLFGVVPSASALCGDCVYILGDKECASPPPNFTFCRIFWSYELYVIAGKIVKVRVQDCEAYVECAV